MDQVSTFATLLIGVITLGTAGGLGWQRGKILRLTKERDDDRTRADRADARADRLERELHQCRNDLDALSRVVTGEAHLTALVQQLDEHSADANTIWREHGTLLRQIAEVVEAYRR